MKPHGFTSSLFDGLCTCGQPRSSAIHGYQTERAYARSGDPDTSWSAADSITADHIRASQAEVLNLFRQYGPMTDEVARMRYHGQQSLSGFRTRRAELVDKGLLVDTGGRELGSTGRQMIVWAVR